MTYDWIDGGNRGAGPERTLLFRSLQEDRGAPMGISRKPRGLQGPQSPTTALFPTRGVRRAGPSERAGTP
jgi:hypothetical protein